MVIAVRRKKGPSYPQRYSVLYMTSMPSAGRIEVAPGSYVDPEEEHILPEQLAVDFERRLDKTSFEYVCKRFQGELGYGPPNPRDSTG